MSAGMCEIMFKQKVIVKAEAATVVNVLMDLDVSARMNPLVSSVRLLEERLPEGGSPWTRKYEVEDVLSFFGFKFRTKYTATGCTDGKLVNWTTQAALWVTTQSIYRVTNTNPGECSVSEVTFVNAPLGLGWYVYWNVRKAHKYMLDKLSRDITG